MRWQRFFVVGTLMNINKIVVAHVVAGLHPASGGPSRTVTHLTDSLASLSDITVTLLCQCRVGEPVVPSANPEVARIMVASTLPLELKLYLPLKQALHAHLLESPPAILHDHGVWLPSNHWVASAARLTNTPLVIQPRGMLEPWAMNYKAWKKRLGMGLYQWHDLKTARVLVATATTEYENLRELGLRQPIAIIPNGVHLQVFDEQQQLAACGTKQQRTVLFLSRVQGKKGLLNLIEAWAKVSADGWRLQIAGPDEDGHLAEVLSRVQQVGVANSVEYVGVVDGEAKSQLYRSADLFVLPTFSENFGVVVAEALAYGVPVITTRGTPWADLETFDCGWWIDIGVDPLVAALRQAMTLSDAERAAMGARGREYVRRYDWDGIAKQTVDVYRWILDQGSKPACVQTD